METETLACGFKHLRRFRRARHDLLGFLEDGDGGLEVFFLDLPAASLPKFLDLFFLELFSEILQPGGEICEDLFGAVKLLCQRECVLSLVDVALFDVSGDRGGGVLDLLRPAPGIEQGLEALLRFFELGYELAIAGFEVQTGSVVKVAPVFSKSVLL